MKLSDKISILQDEVIDKIELIKSRSGDVESIYLDSSYFSSNGEVGVVYVCTRNSLVNGKELSMEIDSMLNGFICNVIDSDRFKSLSLDKTMQLIYPEGD